MSDAYETVRDAIAEKEQVIATYKGCVREMCPHVIGTKRDRNQALFFQFGGESNSGLPEGGEWRCIPVDELTDVSVQPGPWHSGPSHTRPQSCVDEVDLEVDY